MNRPIRRAAVFFRRALALKCPECGTKPIFIPLPRVRSLGGWFTPLDGCTRCGYAYEREVGYFLLATWGVNYTAGCLIGLLIALVLETFFRLPLPVLLVCVISPPVVFNFFFARHAKALFLAFDHFFDPHLPGREGGGGGRPDVHGPAVAPVLKKSPARETSPLV